MSEPHLDEDLAWAPDWPCATCTLLNAPEAVKCVACDSLRPGSASNSGVVVVLPRQAPKRPADGWACPACTLVNPESADYCAACGGERWVKRQMTAAALRARTKSTKKVVESDSTTGATGATRWDHGIWGGLGPDREFLPLPPAPEGRVIYRSAKDDELDMFTELEAAATGEKPPEDPAVEPAADTASAEVPAINPDGVPVEKVELPEKVADVTPPIRPAWRVEGTPLFADAALGDVALDDAVERLASAGVEPAECLLALEAAGGDEDLARSFLWQMKRRTAAHGLLEILGRQFGVGWWFHGC